MNKMLQMVLILGSLLFWGCAETNVVKDEPVKKPIASNDVYGIVIAKSIKDCKEHNIILNEERTNEFMRRSPLQTIEKAAKQTAQTPKKLCEFFAKESSLEKIENVELFTAKIMASCAKVGVTLPKEPIHKQAQKLPFFVVKKGLAMKGDSSLEECKLMEEKYK